MANCISELNTKCWLWLGKVWPPGRYGRVRVKGKWAFAHRVSYEVFVGPIPKGKRVLHHCDVCCCVNPNHLFIGTQKDNLRDAVSKGRNGYKIFHGEDHWKAQFTAEQVQVIKTSDKMRLELAKQYGCSPGAIKHVRSKRAWQKLRGVEIVSR